MIAALVIPAAILAHVVYSQGTVYKTLNAQCVWGHAEISHGGAGFGYMMAQGQSQWAQGSASCAGVWARPGGNIKVHIQFWKYSSSGWSVCYDYQPIFNQVTEDTLTQRINQPRYSSGHPYCGDGWYATKMSVRVYNGGWYGGTVWSGSHYLPTTPS